MAEVAALPEEFRSLEEDFVDSKMAINNAINDLVHSQGSTATAMQLAQARVVEAQRCMKLMSIEVRGKPPSMRKAMQAKVNLYREELQGLLRDLERAQLMARESKSKGNTAPSNFDSQYERLNNNTNRLLRSSQTLEHSHRLVAETEEIGVSVLDTLAQQREGLLSAHEKVRETGAMTTEARRVLQRMTRRIITNTIVLYTTIIILVAAICFVIYHDFIKVTTGSPFAGWF